LSYCDESTMKLRSLVAVVVLSSTGAFGADPRASALAEEFAPALAKSRYMEQGEGRPVTVAGWEGFPTKRYTYVVTDKDGTKKTADVVLLDPTAEQIAGWIVDACTEVKGAYDVAEGRRIFKHILGQSGGQFPVAGVVYEDIIPQDGVYETYCFRDGVTVEVEGLPHRCTTVLTKEQIEASIGGKIKRVFTYARIQSTSPAMWVAAGGATDVLDGNGKPTAAWPVAIRGAYQKAWASNRNELLVAWLKAQAK
jgi:hypothetical protein